MIEQQKLILQIHREIQDKNMITPGPDPGLPQSKEVALNSGAYRWKPPSDLEFLLGGIQYDTTTSRHPSKTQRKTAKLRIFAPQWILRKAYETDLYHHQMKYGLLFRSYNVVDRGCDLFTYARYGDVEGIQRLFDSGQATPFDRDYDGFTALHVSKIMCQKYGIL